MDVKICKYGSKCFRRNKHHFLEFSHPFIEEIALKINNGEIEAVMSLELNSDLVEQTQIVAELMENGELIFDDRNKMMKSNETTQGIKRNASAMEQGDNETEVEGNSSHQKEKRLKSAVNESISTNLTDVSPSTKIAVSEKLNPQQKIEASSPICYFLSSVENLPETWDQSLTLKFTDLLDPSLGVLQESVQFNFMVDIGWLLAQYCQHKVQRKQLLVIYGAESEEMAAAQSRVPTLHTIRVKPKYPFGTHHTKMSMLSYENGGLRIVVHTGNLIESDWEDKTQGIWVSPSCPPLSSKTSEKVKDGDSLTGFKSDLIRYLETYSLSALRPWIEKIHQADMSSIKVCFIPSSPGSHPIHSNKANEKVSKWGHLQLASLLQQHAVSDATDEFVVMQCSSIGSLGPSPSSWLVGELGVSMAASSSVGKLGQQNVKVIYPCFQDVKSSIHGLLSGGCLPYSRQGHIKQPWFTEFLHKWRSDSRLRTKAMPHIKSYARVSSDMSKASFFVLTSANVSKAAWGMKTNKGTTLMIQSFEAGVLFLPKLFFGENNFELGKQLFLPYDLPLAKYDAQDEPWFIDNIR